MLTSNVSPAVTSNAISSLRISSPAGMEADVRPLNVIGVGAYGVALFSLAVDCATADWDCALFVDCADLATYASLIVTGSVPVRFEKWNRNLHPEKQARIG